MSHKGKFQLMNYHKACLSHPKGSLNPKISPFQMGNSPQHPRLSFKMTWSLAQAGEIS